MSVDILVTVPREAAALRRIAVEYDGPTHFVASASIRGGATASSPPPQVNATTRLRNRLLTGAVGLTLLSIPYFEWDAAAASDGGMHASTTTTRDAYLWRRMEEILKA